MLNRPRELTLPRPTAATTAATAAQSNTAVYCWAAGIAAHLDQLILVAGKNHAGGLLTFGLYSDWCPPQARPSL